MDRAPRHPPSLRVRVAELMRDTDLSPEAIAERTGVPYPTVCRWNQRHQWRPSAARALGTPRPTRWSSARLLAVARLHAVPAVDPGDLAVALGQRRERAEAFFRACGLPERGARAEPEGLSGAAVRATLRAHVARQIMAFDARLCAAPPGIAGDSAKVLRDLGGLRKLLDDLDAAPAPPAAPAARPEPDIVALRAEIVARYERFVALDAARAGRSGDAGAHAPVVPGGAGAAVPGGGPGRVEARGRERGEVGGPDRDADRDEQPGDDVEHGRSPVAGR